MEDDEILPPIVYETKDRYNQLCNKIIESKKTVGLNLYAIGVYLNEIRAKFYHEIEFNSFNDFLEKRVEIPRSTAFDVMRIAQDFSSSEWNELGFTKCQLLLKVPKDKRLNFAEFNKSKSTRELGKAVTEYVVETGIQKVNSDAKTAEAARKHAESINNSEEKQHNIKRRGVKLMAWVQDHLNNQNNLITQISSWISEAYDYKEWQDLRKDIHRMNQLKNQLKK